ncbi:MAG: hypothetical protein IAE94_12265 [Chthoniobacterales bacterium]|nr:hypothetical protein [Chthoniobacterales bacterium]
MPPLSNHYAAMEAEIGQWMASGGPGFGDWMLRVHRFQRENNPVYRAFCAGFPEPDRWQDIPAVPVSAFKTADIRSFPAGQTIRTFETSGTTGGRPGRHHFCSLALYLQAATRGWILAGLPAGSLLAIIPHAREAPHSSLSQMAAWLGLRDRFFFNRREELFLELAASPRVVLFGTALAFLDFFTWMGDRSLVLPEGSLAVETGGYKGARRELPKAELYRQFQERLGLPPEFVWNEYGMTELSSQFYTRGVGRPHLSPPWARGLVVDPSTGREVNEGESGILRLFDVANLGSVCAIQTRDLAIRRGEDFELIGRDPAALPRGCSLLAEELLT